MKAILNRLLNQETLSKEESKNILTNISNGAYNSSQIASFLTVFMMRNITIQELSGFREALLDLCIKIDLSAHNAVDLCGTGGDGLDTFNISTLASFVTAGADVMVAKHGNYGVSSISGSSNVLENLGISFSNNQEYLQKCIEKAGICILHAPLFHPAMKNVAPIRKELGVKTFFNMLGPMVNPSFTKNQVVGVFNLELARIYAYLYQDTAINYTILHSFDGYDEISLTSNAKIISNKVESIIKPSDFGVQKIDPNEITGGKNAKESTKIFSAVLDNKGTLAQKNVICANAAMAIQTVKNCSTQNAFEQAIESLESGKAKQKFNILKNIIP